MPPTLVSHGDQVVTARQMTTAIAPNATSTGYNFISDSSAGGGAPQEWSVLKNFTTAPVRAEFDTPSHHYPNTNFQYYNQLRAPNGRIFFPLLDLYTNYYDPLLETITQIGPVVESPPVDPNAATQFYSASFDVGGLLYFGTQESQHRRACIVVTDPTTTPPTQTVIGYVGANSNAYSTYAYYLAPDTATASKYIYVSYGQDPWQLWALEITTGTATKLIEVTAAGNISFQNIAGQGWVATVHTDLGHPDDIVTRYWCLDGALYPYTQGQPPPAGAPATRNVTPASNPVAGAPQLDISPGIGLVGYRFGTSGLFTYVPYTVTYSNPQTIELLVTSPSGVTGSVVGYLGFFDFNQSSLDTTWYGAQSGAGVAQPLALYVPSLAQSLICGYPNGVVLDYTPGSPWQTYPSNINPTNPTYLGPSGNQKAGIKYAGQPATPTTFGATGNIVWSATAHAGGRMFCAGTRDRNGTGAGIGWLNTGTTTSDGTFAAPLDTVQPQGLVELATHSQIVMSTNTLSGSGTAPLYVFDYSLNLLSTQLPLAEISNLGPIFPTSSPDIICGAYINGGVLKLYRWNTQTQAMDAQVTTAFAGAIDCATVAPSDNSVWLAVGNTLVRVDPDTLATTSEIDITSIAPVPTMAFHGNTIFLASGPVLWSADIPQSFTLDAAPFVIEYAGTSVTFSIGQASVLDAGPMTIYTSFAAADLVVSNLSMDAGPFTVQFAPRNTATFVVGGLIDTVPARSYPISVSGSEVKIIYRGGGSGGTN